MIDVILVILIIIGMLFLFVTLISIVVPFLAWWFSWLDEQVYKYGPKGLRDWQRREWPLTSQQRDQKLGIHDDETAL